jgi:hypothetical protein
VSDLSYELRQAMEPDRLLDERIAFHVGWTLDRTSERGVTARWIRPDGKREIAAPFFTFSLDAALSLIPENAWLQHLGWNLAGWTARVERQKFSSISDRRPSAALAICAATIDLLGTCT